MNTLSSEEKKFTNNNGNITITSFEVDGDSTPSIRNRMGGNKEDDSSSSTTEILHHSQHHSATPTTGRIGTLPLAMIVFFNVSGGPFGMEEAVRSAGFFYSILGFAIFPFIWSIPESLMTAELGSAYPEASGGVAWVEEAFGSGAGWMAGYLGWVAGATDNAIYPVLFLDYVVQLLPSVETMNPAVRFVSISVVSTVLGFLNWLGLDVVGNVSIAIALISMSPFVIMVLMGSFQLDPSRWLGGPPLSVTNMTETAGMNMTSTGDDENSNHQQFQETAAMIVGSSVLWRPFLNNLFWCLNSYDSTASYAGEVDNPGRTLPLAMFWAVIISLFAYLGPLLVAIGATDSSPRDWVDGYLATAAGEIGGEWLEAWVILAAGIANISLFQAELSADAYQLMGMAERGFVPKIFATRSRHGTPTYGIMLGVAVIVAMGNFDLDNLIEMLNLNYALSLLLEYASFVKLRVAKPNGTFFLCVLLWILWSNTALLTLLNGTVPRPFRIPLGTAGCTLLLSLPVIATLAVIFLASYKTLAFSVFVNLFGILVYVCKRVAAASSCRVCCGYSRLDTGEEEMSECGMGGNEREEQENLPPVC
jgi:amino acid transporter